MRRYAYAGMPFTMPRMLRELEAHPELGYLLVGFVDDDSRKWGQWIKEQGLKATAQREDIAQVFFAINRHISVEELYREVRKVNPRVGYATVYRTVRLLRECGLRVVLPECGRLERNQGHLGR